jgi:hypothetical protein
VAGLSGCASVPAAPAASAEAPRAARFIGPTSWQGAAADSANRSARDPATPALRQLRGHVPLVYLARGPWSETQPREPSYEVALFDNGLLVYEGHRCVKLGGLVVEQAAPDAVDAVRALLSEQCTGLDTATDDQLCEDAGGLRVTCSNGQDVLSGSDHCRRGQEAGRRLDAVASGVLERLEVGPWLGDPAQRQGCAPGDKDMAPGEITRTIAPRVPLRQAMD